MITLCPFASWKPVPRNDGPAMTGDLGLVVHVQVGNGSLRGWFSDPVAGVSSHLWVSAKGDLEQYVPFGTDAWAEMSGNGRYVSVETEGMPTEPLTLPQATVLAQLIAWGHEKLGWALELVDHGARGITTHAHYPSGIPDPSWGGHPCPGAVRTAQLPWVLKVAKVMASAPPEVAFPQAGTGTVG